MRPRNRSPGREAGRLWGCPPVFLLIPAFLLYCCRQIGPEPDVQEALYLTLLEAQDLSVRCFFCVRTRTVSRVLRAPLAQLCDGFRPMVPLQVFSEHQALEWLGKKIRAKRTMFTRNFRTPVVRP
jgi:hypothetical protein